MRPKAKMLDRLPRILRAPQQQRVRARRSPHGQLIERQTLPSSSLDPGARRGREAQGGDGELGDGEQAVVVGDGADDDDGFLGGGGFVGWVDGHGDDAGEGDGGAVDAGHEEAAEDDFVEGGVGAAWCGSLISIEATG